MNLPDAEAELREHMSEMDPHRKVGRSGKQEEIRNLLRVSAACRNRLWDGSSAREAKKGGKRRALCVRV